MTAESWDMSIWQEAVLFGSDLTGLPVALTLFLAKKTTVPTVRSETFYVSKRFVH